MNNPSQHEFDDELLSAYLDDELSTDERALVESRLAADPEARQTLEHLRSVSEFVRDLPTEIAPRDLRDTILTRATASRAVRSAEPVERPGPESTPTHLQSTPHSQLSSQLPSVTIGRTTRGWVWAAAAIAAAVLIMVLQPRDDRNGDLPNIAQNKSSSRDASQPSKQQLAETQLRDENKLAMGRSSSSSQPPAPASQEQDVNISDQARVATATRPLSTTMTDLGAAPAASQLRDEVAPQAPSAGAPASEELSSAVATASTQPVVVRVLANRAAVDNKAFEALLRKHNVDVEPTDQLTDAEGRIASGSESLETAAPVEAPSADLYAKSESDTVASEDRSSVAAPAQQGPEQRDDVELVLVDAPVSTIFSCMSDLNTDAQNFTSIAVDEARHAGEKPTADDVTDGKRTSELAKFNRGTLPKLYDAPSGADYFRYWGNDPAKSDTQAQSFARARDLGRAEEPSGFAGGYEAKSDRGRARRLQQPAMQSSESRNRSTNAKELAALPSPEAKDKGRFAEQFGVPVAPPQDRMQVLFVIQPSDEPAPSLKAKNRPE